jgi:hypothetical protein
MDDKGFKIVGYLRISKRSDIGFLSPIFQKGGDRFRCLTEESKIFSFEKLDNSYNDYVKEEKKMKDLNLSTNIGDEVPYFFQKGSMFLSGDKSTLSLRLIEHFNSYIDSLDEVKKYDLFNFIGITAQADRERQGLLEKRGIEILQKKFEKKESSNIEVYSQITNSIISQSKYSSVFKKYSRLESVFSDFNLNVRIGENLIDKKVLNQYLNSDSVLKSLTNRYSIEAYIFIKKQCDGTIEGLRQIPALEKEVLSASPKIPCLYKNLYDKWELTKEEIPVAHMLASAIDKQDETMSPSILNMEFEARLLQNKKSVGFSEKNETQKLNKGIQSVSEMDKIMNLVLKNNR